MYLTRLIERIQNIKLIVYSYKYTIFFIQTIRRGWLPLKLGCKFLKSPEDNFVVFDETFYSLQLRWERDNYYCSNIWRPCRASFTSSERSLSQKRVRNLNSFQNVSCNFVLFSYCLWRQSNCSSYGVKDLPRSLCLSLFLASSSPDEASNVAIMSVHEIIAAHRSSVASTNTAVRYGLCVTNMQISCSVMYTKASLRCRNQRLSPM